MIIAVLAAAALAATSPAPPQPLSVAPGVWLIPGSFLPKRQPDGNTVVFRGAQGLVVVDTGRHPWHRQAIAGFAASQHAPIVAIVNSHWHLDHVSGNPDLKRAFPKAKVYASLAIDDALAGFLPKSAADARPYLDSGKLPAETLEDLRADMATIEHGQALRPDVPVTRSGPQRLAGRNLVLNVAPNAATDGDVWVYDRTSGVAAVGDVVTLPAPFLDTACVGGWKAALDQVWATPFRVVIPGHGRPMDRAQFATWRAAFTAFTDCAASTQAKAACAADWASATHGLEEADPTADLRAKAMAESYIDLLRAHGGDSAFCKAPSARR